MNENRFGSVCPTFNTNSSSSLPMLISLDAIPDRQEL
jgi:hypothetical protein